MLQELLSLLLALPVLVPIAFFFAGCACCECETDCSNCLHGVAGCSYQIEVSGFHNLSCQQCTEFDGTYIVNSGWSVCGFSQPLSPAICTSEHAIFTWQQIVDSGDKYRANFGFEGGGAAFASTSESTKPDCNNPDLYPMVLNRISFGTCNAPSSVTLTRIS